MINLLDLGRLTSGFGQRTSPTKGASSNHKGIDIVLENDNIPSVKAGTVSYVGYSNSGGNMIFIEQEDGTTAKYMHMANPSTLSVGDTVKEGQTIGTQGNTGVSTGKHLHFQVEGTSGAIDPEIYLDVESYIANSSHFDHIGENKKENDSGIKGSLLDILGKLLTFIAILLIIVLAVYLFMKAFDISII